MAPNSYSRVRSADRPISYCLDSCLRVLGSFGLTKRSKNDEKIEVLLVLETARLYTWAIALGIVNTTEEPSAVLELTSFYRQKSITEVLRTLLDLLTDDDLITKAYGCLPRVASNKAPNNEVSAHTGKSAGIRLAEVFGNFTTSTRDRIKYPIKQWEITESEKFNLFVIEIRSLVSQLHGMTELLLPRTVRDAMIYTRIWEIEHSWTALVITVACEDVYDEIAAQARDLCDVLDVDDIEVGDNVRGFIGFWDKNGGNGSYISRDDTYDNDSKKADRLRDIEEDLLALKHRVHRNELHPPQHFVSGPDPTVANCKRPMPTESGPWINTCTQPPHNLPVSGVGGPRAQPLPIPVREESVQKPQAKGDFWNFEGDHVWDFEGNQLHGSPPPGFSANAVDDLCETQTTKPSRTARARQPEENCTPGTSSAGPTGRDARNRQQWDTFTSDSELSDDGTDSRSEAPTHPTKKGHGPVSLDEQFQSALLQRQAIGRQRMLAAMQADSQARAEATNGRLVKDREPWPPLQHFSPSSKALPSSPSKTQKQRPAAAEGLVEGSERGHHRHQQQHHHHHRQCGNCGEEMDEAGRLV